MSGSITVDQYIRGKCVQIDRFIAAFIQELNRQGYHTEYCCSGLPSDHPGQKLGEVSAYICFSPLSDTRVDTLKTVMQGLGTFKFGIKHDTRPCIYLGQAGNWKTPVEAEVIQRWTRLSERLGIKGSWPAIAVNV